MPLISPLMPVPHNNNYSKNKKGDVFDRQCIIVIVLSVFE